jgi:hypothetical protein
MPTLDLYTTMTMLKAVEQMKPIPKFLGDMFVADDGTSDDDHFFYDYRKGDQTGLAPFVAPGMGGVTIGREGFEMRQVAFSRLAPQRVITMRDISVRMFGENVVGGMTPAERSKRKVAEDLKVLRTVNQNRRNWMAREVLIKGKLEITRYTHEGREKEASVIANFGFDNFYNPSTMWDQSGARFEYDIEKFTEQILEGGGDVDLIVMGPGVFDTMLENEFYLKSLDLRNADLGELATRYSGQGIFFRGLTRNGVKMVTDVAKFRNDDGNMEYEVPYGHILLGSTVHKPLNFMHGPITKVKGSDDSARHETFVKKEVPFRIGDPDNDTITNRMVSCPTIIPVNVGAWGVMKVLA